MNNRERLDKSNNSLVHRSISLRMGIRMGVIKESLSVVDNKTLVTVSRILIPLVDRIHAIKYREI